MPWNGSGIASLPPVYQAQPGTKIRAEQHNLPLEDIAQMLNNTLPRDGQASMTGNLQMGGRRVTGLGAATQPSDAPRLDQVVPNSGWLASVSALKLAADRFPYATGPNTAALATLTAWARSLLDDGSAPSGRSTLGFSASQTIIDRFNDVQNHSNGSWVSGSSTDPGFPAPSQIKAAIDAALAAGPRTRAFATVRLHDGSSPGVNIVGSSGISGITRLEAGKWRVNLSTAAPNANFTVNVTTMRWFNGGYQGGNNNVLLVRPDNASRFEVWCMDNNEATVDVGGMMLTVTY